MLVNITSGVVRDNAKVKRNRSGIVNPEAFGYRCRSYFLGFDKSKVTIVYLQKNL